MYQCKYSRKILFTNKGKKQRISKNRGKLTELCMCYLKSVTFSIYMNASTLKNYRLRKSINPFDDQNLT